ncbi:hypothetical protein MJH12_19740, partial [bacterium]|nr:hypothetical protein [bacterium]
MNIAQNPSPLSLFKENFNIKDLIVPLTMILCLSLIRWYSGMLLFHTLAELFSIVVGVLMLVVVWNTRLFIQNSFLVYLGIAYFWLAVLDLFHTFGVTGMPLAVYADGQLGIHFWIYTRFLECLLLLSAPIFLNRKLNHRIMFLAGAIISSFVIWLSFNFSQPILLTDQGLTPFKIYSEYLIIAVLVLAIINYTRLKFQFASNVFYYIILSLIFTIASEFSFTFYVAFKDQSFVIGHLFKFLSFWVLYQAIVKTTLQEPFANMGKASVSYDAIPHPAITVDNQGTISQINRAALNFVNM